MKHTLSMWIVRPAGYFSRVLALRQILQDFHAHLTSQGVSTIQILSLGAGFDTNFFNLQANGCSLLQPSFRCDMHTVLSSGCKQPLRRRQGSPALPALLPPFMRDVSCRRLGPMG